MISVSSDVVRMESFQVYNPSGFPLPLSEEKLRVLMSAVEEGEDLEFSFLEVVFVDEKEIVRLNSEYLNRTYVTDIITFRYDEGDSRHSIEGTLYCCAPRIAEQADEFEAEAEHEFYRVFVHGLLHLSGHDDQTEAEKEIMTRLENHYLDFSFR